MVVYAPCTSCGIGPCICGEFNTLEARASGSQGRGVATTARVPTAGQSCFDAGEDGGQPLPAFVPLSPCLHSSTDTPGAQRNHG